MNSVALNSDQKNAFDQFMQFLFSDEKEFIISGAAGVGKTFLMGQIIDKAIPQYIEMSKLVGLEPIYTSVAMTATTNKAADVLSKSTGRPTQTVHSFFNLVVKDDFKTGVTHIKKNSQWRIHTNKVIFIDESSMIDTELWKMLHEGTMNCKLVYVGDQYQLSPIHESISPIYRHNTKVVELLKPVRNAGQPALMDVCNQLRETVNTSVFKPIKLVPGVIDLLDPQQMQDEIAKHFLKQSAETRIMAYTNKQVIAYNEHIRSIRKLPDDYVVGEYLINNSILHTLQGTVPVESELKVIRAEAPSVVRVDEKEKVDLDIIRLDLSDQYGSIIKNVAYPTNRNHFTDLIKYYARMKNWPLYFHLKNDYADLRPRDAATVHKSQGSTYDTVFIDLGNISTCNNPSQVARMLYVAFSRARSRVFLYGELAEKYGGLAI